jgi:hypothetical protein
VFESTNATSHVSYFTKEFKNKYDIEHASLNRVTIGQGSHVMLNDYERLTQYLGVSSSKLSKTINNSNPHNSNVMTTPEAEEINSNMITPTKQNGSTLITTTSQDDSFASVAAYGVLMVLIMVLDLLMCCGVVNYVSAAAYEGAAALKLCCAFGKQLYTATLNQLRTTTAADLPCTHKPANDAPAATSLLSGLAIVLQLDWLTSSTEFCVISATLAVFTEYTDTHVKVGLTGTSVAALASLLQSRAVTSLNIDTHGHTEESNVIDTLVHNMVHLTQLQSLEMVYWQKADVKAILQAVYKHCPQLGTIKLRYAYEECGYQYHDIGEDVLGPVGLKSLRLRHVSWPKALEQQLTSFTCFAITLIGVKLPTTLVHFSAAWCEAVPVLHEGLISLDLAKANPNRSSPFYTHMIPRTVQYLKLPILESGLINALPPALISLDVGSTCYGC